MSHRGTASQTCPAVFWCLPPDVDGWPHANHARAMANTGVHIFSDSDDVCYADAQFVGLYTHKPGPKTIRLPHAADVVEVFSGRSLGDGVRALTDTFAAGETRL